jgi:hypothetical protein
MPRTELRSAFTRAHHAPVLFCLALLGLLAVPMVSLADGHLAHEKGHATASDNAIPRTPAPEGAKLYFITPSPGETVKSPVSVRFGLSGMGVAPAGTVRKATGHHHLLVDTGLPKLDQPVPNDAKHRHFGGGQTEVEIELAPGKHTLQLLLADHAHIPHDPPVVSKQIEIRVE